MPDGHKWCPDCGEVRPWTEFGRNARSKDDRATYCRPCHNARGRAGKEKVGGARTYHLKRRYGITAVDADAMLQAQGGLCAICKAARAAHVDHDHATGAVRALLCFNCNGGLGQFRDDPAVLRAAVAYLEEHAGGATPPATGCTTTPPLGSDRRDRRGARPGRRSTDRPAHGSAAPHRPTTNGPAEEAHG
ncbi:endonuclease VII domain-containing protein [Klenkia sp. PcliD-1-E]|uniref:endonuclease VII domain-containing protein n=1 Tax=Klenkia sp. PcliD-1-E TaxID=2954492 RepID=UPI0020969007|nr:endonuclease VII domain-containing protein [Klenkia sp. PcliD-1-E]MCO7221525.1 endonuclease VII domain-containing protein [Klenkia sp. PcliD-1-E]